MSAALQANLTPGLVRIIRELRSDREAADEDGWRRAINSPLVCFCQLAEAVDNNDATGFWRPAVDAGMVPVLIDMLNEPYLAVKWVMRLAARLLLAAPIGGVEVWAGGLPRAVAGLISTRPPVGRGGGVVRRWLG